MKLRHRRWRDRLSDYRDGTLSADRSAELEEHLQGCDACRSVLAELEGVVEQASALGEVDPPRDLWPGISEAIRGPQGARSERGGVIALPTAAAATGPSDGAGRGGRFALSGPQLAAASIALIALSAMTTLRIATGVPLDAPAPSPNDAVVAVADGAPAEEALAEELADLEAVLETAREVLEPSTVRVLERNLAVIEQAIRDSREALALDPGNAFLTRHLERAYQRKLSYLRDAAQIVDWAG